MASASAAAAVFAASMSAENIMVECGFVDSEESLFISFMKVRICSCFFFLSLYCGGRTVEYLKMDRKSEFTA